VRVAVVSEGIGLAAIQQLLGHRWLSTTVRSGPVSRGYIQAAVRNAGITAQGLRGDALLGQAQANGGDPLQLTHLFGVSDPTAIRYCAEIGIPAQARK
jgi:hypothetical protein